jgi:serine kinase
MFASQVLTQEDQSQPGTSEQAQQHPRYDFRPRKNRIDVTQIHVDNPRFKPPSPTSFLRHHGINTCSSLELGSGHYSKVYKGYQADREVAVKVVRLDQVGADFKKRFIPRERECWSKLRHRNICELYQIIGCNQYNYLFMVMEFCHNGDLLSYIQANGPLSDTVGRRWLRGILDAVNYLHKLQYAHRDIKAENVLISRRHTVKLADFGFACPQPPNFFSRTYCGSRAYSSPEILMGIPYDIYKNDIWSFGVLCFIVMTSSMPFRESTNSNNEIVEQQRRRSYRWPNYVAEDCRQSVEVMLTFQQEKRPSAKQIKSLPFFSRTVHHQAPESMDVEMAG